MVKKEKTKQQVANTPVYNTIIVQPANRRINDIGNWKMALKSADYGSRQTLYDLYDDVLLDGVLTDAIEKRIDAVKDADLSFTIDNKDVDIMYDLIDTTEFEDLIGEIMWSKFWGISVNEFYFNIDKTFGFSSIPRKHIRPAIKQIARKQGDERGIPYGDDINIIQWGKSDDLGLLLKIAPIAIYKRGGFGDWSQFVELFGMPRRIGKYNSFDTKSRDELTKALSLAGSASYVVVPQETEIETEKASTGGGATYKDFREACIEEMLITVLGQTMTTVDGSSLAQGQIHMEVAEKKHRADRRFVQRMLNRHFVPLLIDRGYPITGGSFKFLDNKEELEVNEIVSLSKVIPIPQSYLHEKYNIPLPDGDEPIAGQQQQQSQQGTTKKTEPDDETEPEEEPEGNEADDTRTWHKKLYDFFVQAQRQSWASEILTLKNDTLGVRLIKQVATEDGNAYFNAELFRFTSKRLISALSVFYNDISLVDKNFVYNATDDAYVTAMEQNIFHFSASKTLAEINELNRLFRESKSFNDFYKKAIQVTDIFNKTWLETEFHTAVSTAESVSTYRRLLSKVNIFPYWEYVTVNDDKVREEHRKLHGVILPANDPRWRKIMPPNGWNCRCYIVPRMAHEVKDVDIDEMRKRVDDYFTTPEWKKNEAQGFGINRGLSAEVFTANQMYIKKFPNQSSKVVEKITPREWGVNESIDTLMRESKDKIGRFEGTADEWFEKNKTVVDGVEVLQVEDYEKRVLTMPKKDFDSHTSNTNKTRGFRTEFLDVIHDIAANPDEVWLGRDRQARSNLIKDINNYVMIKFYQDATLAVVAKLEKSVLKLKTWFVVKDKSVRRGLLIKKKSRTRPA